MPSSVASGGRIRTNIPALNAYNSLQSSNRAIAKSQLRLSTGKRAVHRAGVGTPKK